MGNVHRWDCGFGKSALLSLLFSASVLKAHGQLFGYRMYYSTTSLVWEGGKRQIQSNSFSLQSLLMICHHTDRSYSQCVHWFVVSHRSYCSDLNRYWGISAQVMNHFLLGSCFSCTVYVYGFCWSRTECCGLLWMNRQTDRHPQHQVPVAAKPGQTVQSTSTHCDFFENSLKICVGQCC